MSFERHLHGFERASETEIRSRRLSPSTSSRFSSHLRFTAGNPPLNRRVASFFHNVLPPTIQERPLERCRSFAPTSDLALLVQQVDVATGQLLPLLCIIAREWKEKWKILPWQSNVLSLVLCLAFCVTNFFDLSAGESIISWKRYSTNFQISRKFRLSRLFIILIT